MCLEVRQSLNDVLRVCSNSLFYGGVRLINGIAHGKNEAMQLVGPDLPYNVGLVREVAGSGSAMEIAGPTRKRRATWDVC